MNTPQWILLSIYIVIQIFELILSQVNISHARKAGNTVPPEFDGLIDIELLGKTRDYMSEKQRFSYFSKGFDIVLLVVFLFGGIFNWYNSFIVSLGVSPILSGLIFFILLSLATSVINIPFDLYFNFKIESKYGFNKMTAGTWIADFFKTQLLSMLLMSILISAGLAIVYASPDWWWLLFWAFYMAFTLFITVISPYVLEPLFNKFTPLENVELTAQIKELMSQAGLNVSTVYQMDASKRTGHSNAYFTGLGHTKKIVFYDTLLEKLTPGEILAVLSHEAGHWKLKHIIKRIVIMSIVSLGVMYGASALLRGDLLFTLIPVAEHTFLAKLTILGFVGSLASFFITPVSAIFSRRDERAADRFAAGLYKHPEELATALIKLSKDNLSNLFPHPLYAFLYYSHPPVISRIRALKALSKDE